MAGTAIFDLDRTLTRRPTWLRFIYRINRHRMRFWAQVPLLCVHAGLHKLGLSSRTAIKNRFMATLGWAGRDAIEAAGREFAAEESETGLRAGVTELLDRHRAQGDQLYLATAASDFIAVAIADRLGFDGVICTRTFWSVETSQPPAVDGLNCYGAEKVRRVRKAARDGLFPEPLHIYSDHISDLDLLIMAETGVAVNPSGKLRRKARELGLRIVDLEQTEGSPEKDAAGPQETH